jgi:hypothetical protein
MKKSHRLTVWSLLIGLGTALGFNASAQTPNAAPATPGKCSATISLF